MKLNPRTIIKELENNKDKLKEFGVKKIGLFGSYSKRMQTKKSDIDFLVELGEYTFDNYMELKFFLEKLFRKKVDLVIESNLKPAIKYVKEGALYAKAV